MPRGTGFKPRQTSEGLVPATLRMPVHKPRRCDPRKGGCGEVFTPSRPMQPACGPNCALGFVARANAKKAAALARADRAQTRAALDAIKTVPTLKKEVTAAFHAYVRARDRAAGYACICCDRPLQWDVPGGAVDAGHYRSRGAVDHLRFDPDNCHAQRADCNRFGATDYRGGLIKRIGLERVEALEANNAPVKWTREGLRQLRDLYRRKR